MLLKRGAVLTGSWIHGFVRSRSETNETGTRHCLMRVAGSGVVVPVSGTYNTVNPAKQDFFCCTEIVTVL